MFYIFEGPDSVGKSTVSAAFAEEIRRNTGRAVHHWSFPGRDVGTLGWAVYRLHHQPADLGVSSLTASSLQMMHIAAHVDAIESRILPALHAGDSVVLDRFWWSTLVYGILGGVDEQVLDAMINVERRAWRGTTPTFAFVVDRATPFRLRDDESMAAWHQLRQGYRDLADRESRSHPVVRIGNNGTVADAVSAVQRATLAVQKTA